MTNQETDISPVRKHIRLINMIIQSSTLCDTLQDIFTRVFNKGKKYMTEKDKLNMQKITSEIFNPEQAKEFYKILNIENLAQDYSLDDVKFLLQ